MENATGKEFISVTGLTPDITRQHLKEVFIEFGYIQKLYLHHSNNFAKIYYSNNRETRQALKKIKLSGLTHFHCSLGSDQYRERDKPEYTNNSIDLGHDINNRQSTSISDLSESSLNTMEEREVMSNLSEDYVDVHGRKLTVMLDDIRKIYIPLSELKQTGFHIFHKSNFNRVLIGKETILKEFNLHLLGAAEEYIIQNSFNQVTADDINSAIAMCRNRLLDDVKPDCQTPTTITRTIHQTRTRSSSNDNPCKSKLFLENETPIEPMRLPHQNGSRNDAKIIKKTPSQQIETNESPVPSRNDNSPMKNGDLDKKNESLGDRASLSTRWETNKVNRVKLTMEPQDITVAYCEKEGICWAHLTKNTDVVLDILDKSMELGGKLETVEAVSGQIYLGCHDDIWYRVLALKDGSPTYVQFIDYGNRDRVKEVKKIPEELASIPAQAFRVSLAELKGNERVEEDTIFHVKMARQYGDGTYVVKKGNDVKCESLENEEKPKPPRQPSTISESKTVPAIERSPVFYNSVGYTKELTHKDRVMMVSHADGKFYLRNRENYEKYKQIVQDINKNPGEVIKRVVKDQLVICKKEGESNLCRAIVQNISNDLVTVKYIDFQTSDIVTMKSIFEATEEVAKYPSTLVESPVLKNYDQSRFSAEAEQIVATLINDKTKFEVHLENDVFDLYWNEKFLSNMLFPPVKMENVDVQLQLTDHAKSPTSPSNLTETSAKTPAPKVVEKRKDMMKKENSPEANISLNVSSKIMFDDLKSLDVKLGKNDFIITSYNSKTDLNITSVGDAETELLSLVTNIDVEDDTPYTPTLLEMCLGYFEDGWYRCAVSDVSEDNTCEVMFVEYGNVERLPVDKLRKFPVELKDVPMLGQNCLIGGIPDGNKALDEKLATLIQVNQIYEIDVISYDGDRMQYTIEIPSITDILKKDGLL